MSPVEPVREAISALKSSPLLLVVVILNVIFAGAALLYLRAEQKQMDIVLSRCLDGVKP